MSSDILDSLAERSDEHEFYTPFPKGYKAGKAKYVIITGSVMSGVGKGTLSSSIGNLLKCHGLAVAPIKFDGYLNYDAGTLNPFRHGEVFVLDDGTECDLDLGTYERFLNQNLSKDNYLTAGKIFKTIIDKERKGDYLGRDVQFIPHVTGEIKNFVRTLAVRTSADVVLVEVGGTAGDLENSYFLEAMRELSYEEGRENVCFVNVTYIIDPSSLQEQKSKPAQLGLRILLSLGIQPHIILCRARNEVTEKIREKISIYANVPVSHVFSVPNVSNIYQVPIDLETKGLHKEIFKILGLKPRTNGDKELTSENWREIAEDLAGAKKEVTIGIIGKYTTVQDSYLSILKALEHCGSKLRIKPIVKWVESSGIKDIPGSLKGVSGIIVPGGFGKRGTEGKIACIQYAREHNLPYLGLCYGFQMAVVEFARNVCKLDANSTEIDPKCKDPVIDVLPEQKKIEGLGGNMRLGGQDVSIKKGTQAYRIYKKDTARERFRHRYECNPEYIKTLEKHGMVFSGKSPKYPIMQILELPKNTFHIGVQFHPELSSKPLSPHPLFVGFVEAAAKYKPG